MLESPPYQPLLEPIVAWASGPRFAEEIANARREYVMRTGEVFDEDRSFQPRLQAFLDWFVFDRPLFDYDETPVRAYVLAQRLDHDAALACRILGRTVHGLFLVRGVRSSEVEVTNLVTQARYAVETTGPLAGVGKGDLFEGRLVPHAGRFAFSPAFLFHPRQVRRRIEREVVRMRRQEPHAPPQTIIFTLARMACRQEHFRNVSMDAIYDFSRPPPVVDAMPMKFDRASVEARLGRRAGPAKHG